MAQIVLVKAPDIGENWRNQVSVEMSDRRLPFRMRVRRLRARIGSLMFRILPGRRLV